VPILIISATPFLTTYRHLKYRYSLSLARYIADVDLGSDKKLKSELQQAVNTPLNAISAVSRDHLRDKLTKLTQLLSGSVADPNPNWNPKLFAGSESQEKFGFGSRQNNLIVEHDK
jgi:GLE1-like protein